MTKTQEIICNLRKILDDVAKKNRSQVIATRDWKREIATRVASAMTAPGLSSWATGSPEGCGPEWLFDFCTVWSARPDTDDFISDYRAIIVGEIEWHERSDSLNDDFSKLLVVDSQVCFFTFQQNRAEDAEAQLVRLKRAAVARRAALLRRGLTDPPVFLLSCFVRNGDRQDCFIHRCIPNSIDISESW